MKKQKVQLLRFSLNKIDRDYIKRKISEKAWRALQNEAVKAFIKRID